MCLIPRQDQTKKGGDRNAVVAIKVLREIVFARIADPQNGLVRCWGATCAVALDHSEIDLEALDCTIKSQADLLRLGVRPGCRSACLGVRFAESSPNRWSEAS